MHGFVDLQVNGFLGVDFSAPGLSLEQVKSVVVALRARGTVGFCPTIITSPPSVYAENLPVLAAAMRDPELSAALLGIHLEGPFISPKEGARGAHQAAFTSAPAIEEFERLRRLAEDRIRLVTLAPEVTGALDLIEHLAREGICVSLGHHLADRETIEEAHARGARAVTHLGNGIPNLLLRHPNPLWDQLAVDGLTAMLITDGHHIPASFIRVAVRAKGAGQLAVVSDSAPVAGFAPGRYQTLGQEVLLEESGRLWNPAGNHLVGSSSCMLDCMNHLASLGLLSEYELWQVGLKNPLELIGVTLQPDAFGRSCPVVLHHDRFQLE